MLSLVDTEIYDHAACNKKVLRPFSHYNVCIRQTQTAMVYLWCCIGYTCGVVPRFCGSLPEHAKNARDTHPAKGGVAGVARVCWRGTRWWLFSCAAMVLAWWWTLVASVAAVLVTALFVWGPGLGLLSRSPKPRRPWRHLPRSDEQAQQWKAIAETLITPTPEYGFGPTQPFVRAPVLLVFGLGRSGVEWSCCVDTWVCRCGVSCVGCMHQPLALT